MNENSYRAFKAGIATFALVVATALTFSFLTAQQQRDNEFFCNGSPITIQEGDTLYWLTRTLCDGNTMNALDAVVDFYGTTLTVGDTLYLPTHNNCELRMTDGGDVFEDCR
jgi:hypothetical protein